jgi:hypothetical protein
MGASPAIHDIVTGAILIGVAVFDGGTIAGYIARAARRRAVAR